MTERMDGPADSSNQVSGMDASSLLEARIKVTIPCPGPACNQLFTGYGITAEAANKIARELLDKHRTQCHGPFSNSPL